MKTLIVVFAIFIGFATSTFAVQPPTTSLTASINAKVYHPCLVEALQPDHHELPNIQVGQVIDLSAENLIRVFHISKQDNWECSVVFGGTLTDGLVTLSGTWYQSVDLPAPGGNVPTGIPITGVSTTWGQPYWEESMGSSATGTDDDEVATADGMVESWFYVKLTSLDASAPGVVAGDREFMVSLTTCYKGI